MISRSNIIGVIGYLTVFLLGAVVYSASSFVAIWGYYGFTDEYSLSRLLASLGVLVVLSLITPVSPSLSTLAMHMALMLIIIPTLILYAFAGKTTDFLLVSIYAYGVFLISICVLPCRLKMINVLKLSPGCMVGLLTSAMLIILVLIAYLSRLMYFNLNIWKVYEFRAEIDQQLPSVFIYLTSWCAKVFAPVIAVIGLHWRRYGLTILGVSMGVGFFSFTAHKSALFFPLLACGVYVAATYYVRMPKKTLVVIFTGMLLCLLISLYDFAIPATGEDARGVVGTLFYRRGLMIPSLLNSFYLETFGSHENYWLFSDKAFTFGVVARPSEMPIPYLIGEYYFPGTETGSNAGWIGSGFAQLGISGVALYSFLLALYCRLGDMVARDHGIALALSILVIPVIAMLTSSDFFTVMLSHGGGLSLLIILLLKRDGSSNCSTGEWRLSHPRR